MDTNKTTASSGMLEGAEYEKKLKQYYGDMLVYKSSANSKFFSALSLPSFMRDWLVMRFSNSEGVINKQEVSDYVKRVIPKKEQWNEYLVDLLHNDQTARFLAKVKIDFDYAWLHHIHQNPHHWQHWVLVNDDEGSYALEMPKEFVYEMICDWWSFSHKTGNLYEIFDWYKAHSKKMILHENTRKLVEEILDKIKSELDREKK